MFGLYQILASVAVSLAIGFGGGWATNGWRLGAEISQLQAQQAINLSNGLKTALDQTIKFQKAKDEALKKAESRAAANAASASAARTESDGLRDDLATARAGLPSPAPDASGNNPSAESRLLDTMAAGIERLSQRGEEIARAANGHASDTLTLQQAWPK